MHELSIAQSIVDTVLRALEPQPDAKVCAVRVKIGQLTDIVPDALSFGFSVITPDTRLADASLVIESVPIHARCRACSQTFAVENFRFVCPHCQSRTVDMTQGDELLVASVEIEEPVTTCPTRLNPHD